MNGKKAKAARRAAKMLVAAVGGDQRSTYQKMKQTIKQPEIRKKMYG